MKLPLSSLQVLLLLPSLAVTREVISEEKKVWRAEVLQENVGSSRHCSSPTGSVDGKILVEDDGGQMTDFTTITWQIGLGETLCYKFKSESSGMSGTVEVTYVSLKSIYSIMDSYKFPLARSDIQCSCDCPGGASHCDSGADLCKNSTNCVNYYNPSVQSSGCFLQWMQLSAAMCCQIKVTPISPRMYRAVHLSVPSVVAQFKTVYRDSEGLLIDSRNYNVDLNSGTTIDWDVSLQVSSSGPSTLVPPGWYVSLDPDTPSHTHTLLAGLDINDLDGWDITKLGWMKAGRRDDVVTASLDLLSQSFSPVVENCAQGHHHGYFPSGVKIDQERLEQGRPLQQMFPFISGVRTWRRHVELEHGESPLLSLTLQHRSRVGVVVQFSSSHLQDFTGVLYQDSSSHLHLNLSLVEAAGTLSGVITGLAQSQSVLLRLPLVPGNSSHQVKLTATECRAGQVRVSLKPLSRHNRTVTRDLPCISHNMRTFRHTLSQRLPAPPVPQDTDCLSCVQAWLHWLSPQHWLDTIWPQSRVVIVTITLIFIIIIIVILARVLLSICRCCGCIKRKK